MKPRIQIWFELETRCNLRCKFCFNFWKDGRSFAPQMLSTRETLEGLQRLFDAFDCEQIAISGGEPLLREDLYDILSFIKGRGVPMVITSNGTLLDKPLIRRLMEAGIGTFQLPFHATNPVIHDMLSGGTCWKETLKAFIALREVGAHAIAVFVATLINLKQFSSVMDICSELGIRQLIFNRFVPSGAGLKNHDVIGVPEEDSLISTLLEANKKAENLDQTIYLGMPINIPVDLQPKFTRISMGSCPVRTAQRRWTIDAAGNIRRCNHSGEIFGNLLTDGINRMVSELSKAGQEAVPSHRFQGCHILNEDGLVQIRATRDKVRPESTPVAL